MGHHLVILIEGTIRFSCVFAHDALRGKQLSLRPYCE